MSRLIEDTAWQPVWQKEIESSPLLRKAIIFGYGPIRPWMSIAHWYFFLNLFCVAGRTAPLYNIYVNYWSPVSG